jgi:four helix bundle protein
MTNIYEDKINSLRTKIKSFVISTINFCRQIPRDDVNRVFIGQLLRSSTSIGANYEEATESESNKDAIHKLAVVKKEAKESKYWLELIKDCVACDKNKIDILIDESGQLIRIFSSLIQKRKS